MRTHRSLILATALVLCGACTAQERVRELPAPAPGITPAHGVVGVTDAQLSADFWIDRLQQPDLPVMEPSTIAAQNRKLLQLDESMNELHAFPETMDRRAIAAAIDTLSALPDEPLYDVAGEPVPTSTLHALRHALDLEAIPPRATIGYGLALRRTALRKFPTTLRVFSSRGDTDIDRFQESALFPGTAVAIMHRSQDRKWLWVASENYQAWVWADDIAAGSKPAVLGYAGKQPFRVVSGAKVATVHAREQPALSELQLDMGVRVPLAAIAADALVNGQHSYTSWVLELPVRGADGALAFAPALLQKNQDTAGDYLPLTRANIVRQAFKFLGERYGWGHSYNGRDCSGFVSEVYRSMGVQLPRNTRDQSISPALEHTRFDDNDGAAARKAAVDALQVGDLIYIPGHVMMMIGRVDGAPYVIHDTNGGSYLDADGEMRSMHLNAVSVTPLLPLRFNQTDTYVDRITSIVRIRP